MTLSLVGILGDAHAEDLRVERALAFFHRQRVDAVLCVGDAIDGFGDDNRTVRLLESALSVRGNHERWFLEGAAHPLGRPGRVDPEGRPRGLDWPTYRWCESLPAERTLHTNAGSTLLCHGVGPDDMHLLLSQQSDDEWARAPHLREVADAHSVMICGHTHQRMVRTFDRLTVINAGTLDRRTNPGCVLVDFAAREARYFDVAEHGEPRPALTHRF